MAGSRTAVLRRVVQSVAEADRPAATDRELLRRFARDNDQAAFEALVNRHAAMVLGVCRRALPTVQDAEDACQATFLVLANRAKDGRWQESVANWLYTTARRVAHNARVAARRRAKREAGAAVREAVEPVDRMTGRELLAALDAALDGLPARYREPLVLCYLEGLTRDEAAARLGVPLATLHTRIDRARKRLHAALTKAGCALGAGLLALAVSSPAGAFPPRLVKSILSAASGPVPAAVGELVRGVAVNASFNKAALALLVAVGAAVTGFGLASVSPTSAEPLKPATQKPEKAAAKADVKGGDKPNAEAKERTIRGTVLGADGKPIRAELSLIWVEGKSQPLGMTREDGTFEVTVPFRLKEGGGWLVATAAGHGMDFHPHGVEHLPQSMKSAKVTLKLPKERPIRGRVLNLQGKPVAGATVAATSFGNFDGDAAADDRLKKATEPFNFGGPPHGDRSLGFEHVSQANPHRRSPYVATTDKDGRFEIKGVGAGQLVTLSIRATGIADTDILTLNRDGFDPDPVNKAALDNETAELLPGYGGKWHLYGPDPVVAAEPEKLIRGTVTDHTGKPRPGVRVTFSRPNKDDFNPDPKWAVTDKDGRYEIRGARRHTGYMVECPSDPEAGLLSCQGFADDTVGLEPVTVDLKCAKGLVITGTVKDKATGQPVRARLDVEVLVNNPFVKKYPPFLHSATADRFQTDADGRFRVVAVPGPVLLMALPSQDERGQFKPAAADPKYPDYFSPNEQGGLMFHSYSDDGRAVRGFVRGAWCKVLDLKADPEVVKQDILLEPAK